MDYEIETKELTKQEAIEAMRNGAKITHRHFSSDEFMFMPNPRANMYEFEDGVRMSGIEFWEIRHHESFETGWYLFKK